MSADNFNEPAGGAKVATLYGAIRPEMTTMDAVASASDLNELMTVDAKRKVGTTGHCTGGAMTSGRQLPEPVAWRNCVLSRQQTGDTRSDSPHRLIPETRASALIAIAENEDKDNARAKTVLRESYDRAKLTAQIEVYWHDARLVRARYEVLPSYAGERAWSRLLLLFGKALALATCACRSRHSGVASLERLVRFGRSASVLLVAPP